MLKRFEFRQVINEYLSIKKEKEGKEIKLYWKKVKEKSLKPQYFVEKWKKRSTKEVFNQRNHSTEKKILISSCQNEKFLPCRT